MEVVPSASGAYPYKLEPLNEALDTNPPAMDAEFIDKLHGLPPHWREDCLTCHGAGHFKTRLLDDSVVTCECNCREQWILLRRMQAANIDNEYARLSWKQATGVPDEVAMRIREYQADMDVYMAAGLGFTLYGDRRGTGKTLLTTLLLKEAMAAGKSVFFVRFLKLLDLYSKTWKDDSQEAWFARRIERADMVGIDDIGKEGAQEGRFGGMIDRFLDGMLRGRVANSRVTIVNSNLDPHGERAADSFARYQQDVLELLSEVNETIELHRASFRAERRQRKLADAREGVVYPVVVR